MSVGRHTQKPRCFSPGSRSRDPSRTRRVSADLLGLRDERAFDPQIRYQFRVPGDQRVFSATDLTGMRNLWTPIDRRLYEQQIQGSRRVEVIYLVDDPWINQPVGRTGQPLFASLLGWITLFVIDAVWVFETYVLFRNYVRCLTAAERRQSFAGRFWRTLAA